MLRSIKLVIREHEFTGRMERRLSLIPPQVGTVTLIATRPERRQYVSQCLGQRLSEFRVQCYAIASPMNSITDT